MDKDAYILLNLISGMGPKKIGHILALLGSPSDLFKVTLEKLKEIAGVYMAEKIKAAIKERLWEREKTLAARENIEIVTAIDDDFPALLREINYPPPVIYLKGDRKILSSCGLSVVGSRRATFYGIDIAEEFSFKLAAYGVVIVSGLARGIDTAAHRGALRTGKTIAVLGSGLFRIYPRENISLADKIALNGAIISEFPLECPPKKENFPRRNRLISGLSRGVFVVEATKHSGALITANYAVLQNRDVFCLPGPINSPTSAGTNALIKEGAFLVEDIADILRGMGIDRKKEEVNIEFNLSPEENTVYNLLGLKGECIDNISVKSGISIVRLSSVLLQLRLKGFIKETTANFFTKVV